MLRDGVDLADGSKKCGAGDTHTIDERDDSDDSAVAWKWSIIAQSGLTEALDHTRNDRLGHLERT